MNTVAQLIVLLWVTGWTLAMLGAGRRARDEAIPRLCGEKFPEKSTGIIG